VVVVVVDVAEVRRVNSSLSPLDVSFLRPFRSRSDCIHSVQLQGISSSSRSLSVTSAIGFSTLSAQRAWIPIHITSVSKGTQSGSLQDTSVTMTWTLSLDASGGNFFKILV